MDILEQTTPAIWQQRRKWIENEIEHYISEIGECEDGIHAPSLFFDMSLAFCSGAWISVIVMSISVIDSHLRETEVSESEIRTIDVLKLYFKGGDINWLRKLRNKFVHVKDGLSVFNEYDYFKDQDKLEEFAKKAIKVSLKALFQTPLLP